MEYLYDTIIYIHVESNCINSANIIIEKNNILMYILTDHIVTRFEVHYSDIDKLWGCLNILFLINQYYFQPGWDSRDSHQLVSCEEGSWL